jgi:NADPH2:quinone reductase
VNFTDTESRRGVADRVPLPWVPGIEASGTVTAVGEGVAPELVGRRVVVVAPPREQSGCYATALLAPVSRLFPLPDALSLEAAAALAGQGLTAWHLLNTMTTVQPGRTVLVHSAAGGVGHLAVQLARRAGARVLGTTSHRFKLDAIATAGAEPFLLDRSGDWVSVVLAATGGRGADLVLDAVGAPTQAGSLAVLAAFGRLIHYGSAGGEPSALSPESLYDRSLTVSSYWLWTPHDPERMSEAAKGIFTLATTGELRAKIDAILPLADAAEAHRRLESGRSAGKLLLRVGESA